jgi:CDP-diacylglycerol--glycerol-3-phosphate 3-phosphatidyltransferase
MLRNIDETANGLRRAQRKSLTDLAHEWMAIAFAPLARWLFRLKVTPNAITVVGCAFSLAGGALIAVGHWWVAAGVLAFGGLLDGVDGLLARQSQQMTPFGAFLDSVLDRWSDSAYFVGLLIWYSGAGMPVGEALCAVSLASSLLVSYTRARAEGVGAQCKRGLFTRLERLGTLLAGLVLGRMTIALWIVAVLSTFTALQRIYYTWQYLRTNSQV